MDFVSTVVVSNVIVLIIVLIICLTITSIHKRNKKAEIIKECVRAGFADINVEL